MRMGYWTGKKLSDEHRKKLSESHKGIKPSEETKQKMRQHSRMGKHLSEEHKSKISEAHKNLSEESRNNIAKARTGKKHSYETRKKLSENLKGKCGEQSRNWQGGINSLPYCEGWTEELREEIRERDGRICQECSKTELQNGKKLAVHHIHYIKKDCYPDLIALCNNCNLRANANRKYWEEHYMEKLKERNLLNYFGDIK